MTVRDFLEKERPKIMNDLTEINKIAISLEVDQFINEIANVLIIEQNEIRKKIRK